MIADKSAPRTRKGIASIKIARAKAELFEALDANSYAVINSDDELIKNIVEPFANHCNKIYFGTSHGCEISFVVRDAAERVLGFEIDGKSYDVRLNADGIHNAYNAAAAAAAALALNCKPEEIVEGLHNTVLPAGRLQLKEIELSNCRSIKIIDDTYTFTAKIYGGTSGTVGGTPMKSQGVNFGTNVGTTAN